MKRVLGLDLGSTSLGWAIIEENSCEVTQENAQQTKKDNIVGLGCRIIPLSTEDSTQFAKGQALTKNADRTVKRTQRKGYDRYQLRRSLLLNELQRLGMYGGKTLRLSTLELWGLRAKAVDEQISLLELGRVLCHINQKRGYRTSKSDYGDKKQGEYVKQVVGRYNELHEKGVTIGQFLYDGLKSDPAYRCKDQVFPRDAYIEEFDAIMDCQRKYYPEVLSNDNIAQIRDYIIFHQRPLKSCKHLVSRCELERREIKIGGQVKNCAPKVAPRSSPLFQVCKIWESINNIKVRNKSNDVLFISLEQKQAIFNFMNTHEKLNATTMKSILCEKSKEWQFGKAVGTGLQGNTTYCAMKSALGNYPDANDLLRFELNITDGNLVDIETGELTKVVDANFEQQPLYRLWHMLYSISDIDELRNALTNKFGIKDSAVLDNLCRLDFVKSGYSNKSSLAIRKILPYLQEGMQLYEAKIKAGYDDTTLTKEQNEARELADKLSSIQRGELRQPVVEKILNQLVNLVNALMDEYGRFDEIRVELARELKQSREERESATNAINRNQKENETIAQRIKDEYNIQPTRSRIQKYKMWVESDQCCIYCGKTVNVTEFLSGFGVEVEHVIPRSVLFDDSFSNKVCSCRECNKEKNNRTAYDYMKSKGEDAFNAYVERINDLAERKCISKTKRNNLLMSIENLPSDFIERQLRESQYIAKKAKEILQSVCRNVYSTSGNITDFIRHIWGWDEVLHSLNLERYRNAHLTSMVERARGEYTRTEERIQGWSKRIDHRHHAIDALTIACTKQGYIQRINNLNSLKEVAFSSYSSSGQDEATRQRLTRLERYLLIQPHFSFDEVQQAIAQIAVSFKGGKRVATLGKRYIRKGGKRVCVQKGIIIPRGALSEESVYGRIHNSDTGKREYVLKYKIDGLKLKDVDYVVDKRIREILRERLTAFNDNPNKAFAEPVYDHQGRAISSVRCYTGLKDDSVMPLRYNQSHKPTAFVKPGNNHHVAIYEDECAEWQEHIVSFWHAVERKKYGIPTIITNTGDIWDQVSDKMPESFQKQIPQSATWRLKFSMQQNEMFILGMDEDLYRDAMINHDYALLSKYLYRVQKLSSMYYVFRHHIETSVDDKYDGKKNEMLSLKMEKMHRIRSMGAFMKLNPHKVHISITGKIREI